MIERTPPLAQTSGSIDRLLNPETIAIVGMSSRPNSVGRNVLANLRRAGFHGAIHLVGRHGGEIDGLFVLTDVSQLPEGVDLAVLAVPAAAAVDTLVACAAQGVRSAVCFASGFAEMGDAGRKQQRRMKEIAAEHRIALLGPNTIGFYNLVGNVQICMIEMAEPMPLFPPDASGIAVLAQSGSIGILVADSLRARGVPICHIMPTGNEADLAISTFVRHFADDPRVGCLAVYAEQISSPRDFLVAARHARSRGKPIVIFHPGQSDKAKQASSSHTGSLAGDHTAMRVQAERAGVVVVETLEELVDLSQILLRYPDPPVGGVGIVTGSGAIGAILLDYGERLALGVPELSAETSHELRKHLADYTPPRNPLDVGTLAGWKPELLSIGTAAMLSEPHMGSMLVSMPSAGVEMAAGWLTEFVKGARGNAKPAIYVIQGESGDLDKELVGIIRDSDAIVMRSPERALRALARVDAYARGRRFLDQSSPEAGEFYELPSSRTGTHPEWLGKKVLAAIGVNVPAGQMARTELEAVAVASELGYPVAMKAQSAALAHKSDSGGVLLNINDEDALRVAWQTLHTNVAQTRPDVTLDGVLVEAMGRAGLEMVIGARRDPSWGPILMVGLGGIWVEALGDVRFVAADLPAEAIREELQRLQGAKLLAGFRGSPTVDIDAICQTVTKIGRLMIANPEIREIDVNPLMVYPRGEGVLALDALIATTPAASDDETESK